MQNEFKLTPLAGPTTYKWENGAWPNEDKSKYAVLYKGKILAIFDTLYWADQFKQKTNLVLEIMKVDE